MEYDEILFIEEQDSVEVIESIEVIDVYGTETYEIDSDDAFPALGEANDDLQHQLLNGRELSDQHPITAITGLRNELDAIEALQTVYSDKKQLADYYEWEDGNILIENRLGHFVSIHNKLHTIKICKNEDIFGVAVDDAAFIGGQDNVVRDYKYGLVVHSGVVDVLCESDIAVGDYVISNEYGVAKKSNSNCGCKVIAIKDLKSITYATIMLNISDSQMFKLGNEVNILDGRMDAAEFNITAAINAANKAQQDIDALEQSNKELGESVGSMSAQVSDAVSRAEYANQLAADAKRLSAEAEAIANSAAASAMSMSLEAIERADQALSDVSEAIGEFNTKAEQMSVSINDAGLRADKAVEDLKSLKDEMLPLDEWKDDNGNSSFAGFVAKADENSAILADLVTWDGTVNDSEVESLAGIKRVAAGNKAELGAVASYKKTHPDGTITKGLAGLVEQVDENHANVSLVAEYSNESSGNSGIAGFVADVNNNTSTLDAVAQYSGTNENGETVTGLAGLRAQVDKNKSDVSLISKRVSGEYVVITNFPEDVNERDEKKFYYKKLDNQHSYWFYDGGWTSYQGVGVWDDFAKEKLNENTIYYIMGLGEYWWCENKVWRYGYDAYEAGLPANIAGIQVVTDDNSSKIDSLTAWQGETGRKIAQIKQEASENGASIQLLVASIDKYSVGEYSQAYGLTYEQAKSILKQGMIYVPVNHPDGATHTEKYDGQGQTNEFTEGNYYIWSRNDGIEYDWIEYGNAVVFSDFVPDQTGSLKFWYINSNTAPEGYEAHTLYLWQKGQEEEAESGKWVAVATLYGNLDNRKMSLIRQTADGIALEVTNARGNAASLDARITNNESSVTNLAQKIIGDYVEITDLPEDEKKRDTTKFYYEYPLRYYFYDSEWQYYQGEGKWKVFAEAKLNKDTVYYLPNKDLKEYWWYNKEWKYSTNILDVEGLNGSLSVIRQTADDSGASIAQVVRNVGKDGTVNAASIVTAVNDSGSTVKLEGDHIILNGAITNGNQSFQIHKDGYMIATGGNIGGWLIDSTKLYKPSKWGTKELELYGSGISSTAYDNDPAFYAGFHGSGGDPWQHTINKEDNDSLTGWTDYVNFYVTNNGKLFANNAEVKGKITATSGTIGSWNIGDSGLYYDPDEEGYAFAKMGFGTASTGWALWTGYDKSTGDAKFRVTQNGEVYAKAGQIGGWTIDSTKLFRPSVWNGNALSVYGSGIAADGGNNNPAFYAGFGGNKGNPWAHSQNVDGNGNVINGPWQDHTNFYVTNNGFLRAKNAEIDGIITASSGRIGKWEIADGKLTGTHKYKIETYNYTNEVEISPSELYVWHRQDNIYEETYGVTWDLIASSATMSDQRIKTNIANIDDRFDELFDKITPRTFQYTTDARCGNTNNTHFGFVAQEIISAQTDLDISNLSFVHTGEYYSLKMQEFISLNTWQIQKAKARITELEERVAQLEKLLKE